ncbi:iron-sulfur cluster biosynthesis family protein [Lactiplantibacillus garii]|uniref:Iron-sulfur cluster biosynthesis family protein n=1 Tax=Lactiplantibacillus garii TaxID=2306423 RepID=A0A3R8LJ98_9LACO|nr:iron-sulfur cluster biosynthesis family protein [Lactiplantibacillus garii]RRK10005.1 iron-sulfur cluster biosynthesis family protein [Lactiplantibacillus garii]
MTTLPLTFTEEIINKLQPHLTADKRLLLTFEDGVGTYSQHAAYHMQTQFTVNVVARSAPVDGYDVTLDSNLGPVLIKGYSQTELQRQMTLKLNVHQSTWQLTGETGMIDDNVGFIDFTDPNGVKNNPAR